MKKLIIAAFAVMSLGAGVASAAPAQHATGQNGQTQTGQSNSSNWLEGGGG